MNVAAIKKRCVEYGQCLLITNGTQQWIGTGREFYPVDGVRLTAEGIPGLFGLTEKEQTEMEIREEENQLETMLTLTLKDGEDEICRQDTTIIQSERGEQRQIIGQESRRRRWIYLNSEVPARRKGVKPEVYIRSADVAVLAEGYMVLAVIATASGAEQRALERKLGELIGLEDGGENAGDE